MTLQLRRPRTPVERALVYPAIGAMMGCWAGAIPIGLDWERPWQVRTTHVPESLIEGRWLIVREGMATYARVRRGGRMHCGVSHCPRCERDSCFRTGRPSGAASARPSRESQEVMIQQQLPP